MKSLNKTLLDKGNRTKTKFCEDIGMSRVHLDRILNEDGESWRIFKYAGKVWSTYRITPWKLAMVIWKNS